MNRRLRAGVAAAAIAPATVAGIALIRCGCSQAAWTIEIATAVIFSSWIVAAEDDSVRQKVTFREQDFSGVGEFVALVGRRPALPLSDRCVLGLYCAPQYPS